MSINDVSEDSLNPHNLVVQPKLQDRVWVAYVSSGHQFHIEIAYVEGMTVREAIIQSGIEKQTILPDSYQLGIFSTKIKDDQHVLQSGDRVEIYRALTVNPKDIRRKRAAANPSSRYCQGNRFKSLLK